MEYIMSDFDLDSPNAKRRKLDSDVLLKNGVTTNSSARRDETNECNMRAPHHGRRFSCWDVIDADWMNDAEQDKYDRLYVHREILEWIVEHINESILSDKLRANVEEVFHHNLDGPVYLIKFYKQHPESRTEHKILTSLRHDKNKMLRTAKPIKDLDALTSIKDRLKYKMAWKSRPTYFLRIDSSFKDRKNRIINGLHKLNLHDRFNTKSVDLNWMYIPKIEIYEFAEDLSNDCINQIDSIFRKMSKSRASIYVCDQFEWHRHVANYIEVDKVAMDMCVEEWRRHNLLKDFSIDNILRLELANKDYRDQYCNEYLERYIDILIRKSLPELAADDQIVKLEFPLERLDFYLENYFVSRFYDKISIACDEDRQLVDSLDAYDIPIIEKSLDELHLKGGRPHPDTLLAMKCHTIEYNISNYTHFSDSLFRALLDKSSVYQRYSIRFDKGFNFVYAGGPRFSPNRTRDYNWTSRNKQITIKLEDCTKKNVDKLVTFAKYLFNLFNERKKLDVIVSVYLNKCELEDYSFLENIGDGISHIHFQWMNISSRQIRLLSRILTQQKLVAFLYCRDITDSDVMSLLDNIDLDHLCVEGENACTPAIFYLMADHLMIKEGVATIKANRFNGIINVTKYGFDYDYDRIEFFRDYIEIRARNHHSKEGVDIYWKFYCFVNGINEHESIDPSNKMFMENTYSCYDKKTRKFKRYAHQYIGDQSYVHQDALGWIVEVIHEQILNNKFRADVEEVHHHNLDGQVFLIKFYYANSICPEKLTTIRNTWKEIIYQFEYKMPWKLKPTYFLQFGSGFDEQKGRVEQKLQELNLLDCVKVATLDVNWRYLPKIETYEFMEFLNEDCAKQIDSIFEDKFKARATLFICSPFEWHREVTKYIQVDKVAMDMCIEEWRRYDLLKDFSVDQILCLDLANKDYRDPYPNEYLDRYINILLNKLVPQLSSSVDEKIVFPWMGMNSYLMNYFISRFHTKISVLSSRFSQQIGSSIYTYNIPNIYARHEILYLKRDQPSPDKILETKYNSVQYNISNYSHFNDSLFRGLLNKSSMYQLYKIRINDKFHFVYERDNKLSSHLTSDYSWTPKNKKININLMDCNEDSLHKLVRFVEYLIDLFNGKSRLDTGLCFTNCCIEDFSFLVNIGTSFDYVSFYTMSITSPQIKLLSRVLSHQRKIIFSNCNGITDSSVMALLENIAFDCIWLEGENAITPVLYFLLAEHLMDMEGSDTIQAHRLCVSYIPRCLYLKLIDVDFFKDGTQIVMRNRSTNQIIDSYCFLNDIEDGESYTTCME